MKIFSNPLGSTKDDRQKSFATHSQYIFLNKFLS